MWITTIAQAAAEHAPVADAAIKGNITVAVAALGAAVGVGMVGSKAAEAVGRNPGAFGQILTIGIIGMALAEAIVFYALFLAK
jgi:F-type H+-transporting ATPase subunit c